MFYWFMKGFKAHIGTTYDIRIILRRIMTKEKIFERYTPHGAIGERAQGMLQLYHYMCVRVIWCGVQHVVCNVPTMTVTFYGNLPTGACSCFLT